MEYFTILAWLPGETSFYAQKEDGQVGLLSKAGFIMTNPEYVDSAVIKWGFKDLRGLGVQASQSQLDNLGAYLASLSL